MADALGGVGDEREATLVVANAGVEPVLLEEGDVVGSLQQCTLAQPVMQILMVALVRCACVPSGDM